MKANISASFLQNGEKTFLNDQSAEKPKAGRDSHFQFDPVFL
ncbi:hypothetical protein B4144_2714 [Bacillus atrophaeus]|nr:hypothetical protein B4144_2714 [Bacillus atrophaeus]